MWLKSFMVSTILAEPVASGATTGCMGGFRAAASACMSAGDEQHDSCQRRVQLISAYDTPHVDAVQHMMSTMLDMCRHSLQAKPSDRNFRNLMAN